MAMSAESMDFSIVDEYAPVFAFNQNELNKENRMQVLQDLKMFCQSYQPFAECYVAFTTEDIRESCKIIAYGRKHLKDLYVFFNYHGSHSKLWSSLRLLNVPDDIYAEFSEEGAKKFEETNNTVIEGWDMARKSERGIIYSPGNIANYHILPEVSNYHILPEVSESGAKKAIKEMCDLVYKVNKAVEELVDYCLEKEHSVKADF
jgi:hypothetical protein